MNSKVVSLSPYKMNYQVSGEESIGELLKFFETSYVDGKKSFAISSTHYHSLQQKLILAVMQFFNKKYPNIKIATISFACDSGNFQEFSTHASATKEVGINNFGKLFDLISWDYLIENKLEQALLNRYDLLLWELPELEKMVSMADVLTESLAIMDAAYLISNRLSTQSKYEFAEGISQYFLNHGVNIAHLFVEKHTEEKKAS
jgi:hypothetical protein